MNWDDDDLPIIWVKIKNVPNHQRVTIVQSRAEVTQKRGIGMVKIGGLIRASWLISIPSNHPSSLVGCDHFGTSRYIQNTNLKR